MFHKLMWITAFCLVMPAFCQVSEREAAIGRYSAADLERSAKVVADPAANAYVSRLTSLLAPYCGWHSPVTVKLLQSDQASGMSLPGGHVYLTTGVLARTETEAELAAVIAHQLGHLIETHEQMGTGGARVIYLGSMGQCLRWARNIPIPLGWMPQARLIEQRADLRALGALMGAGYDPRAFPEFFSRFIAATPNLGEVLPASHLETLRVQAERALLQRDPIVTTAEFVDVRNRLVPPKPLPRPPSLRAGR